MAKGASMPERPTSRFTEVKCLYRGYDEIGRQFTITLAKRKRENPESKALERIGTFLARLKQPQATRNGAIVAVVLIICTWLVVAATTRAPHANGEEQASTQGRRENGLFYPPPKQWASLTTVPVGPVVFRSEHMTEGKIAIDEDRSTLVFSPYSGRVIKLLAKPGDRVKAGQPLFTVEAPDMVQAQNAFIAAISKWNKTKSAFVRVKIVEQQNKILFDSRAGLLRDLQFSYTDTATAE